MNLIYDRTEADATEAVRIERKLHKGETLSDAESAAWNAGMKGGYNAADMNRVESAVTTLAAELNAAGYPVEISPILKGNSRVPTGYTEVEYIESSGTQYIDTGYACSKSDHYELETDAQLTNDTALSGANGYMQYAASLGAGARCVIKVAYQNNIEKIYVNGVLNSTKDWTSEYNGTNVKIGLLKLGDAGNAWYTSAAQSGKTYSAKLRKAGTLVRDFVPCKNPSGAVGLYDTVSKTFFANAGTGSFTAGSDVGSVEDREWQKGDVLHRPQWATYLDNVQRLRDAYYTLTETGQLPKPEDKLGYVGANNIEKVLADIDLLIDCMKSSYRRCGTFRVGNNAAHLPLKGSV